MKPKNKKELGVLSLRKAVGWGGVRGLTEGKMLAARFCEAVREGQTPAKADLDAVAYALAVLVESGDNAKAMAEVARRLGASTRQGKKLSQERRNVFDEWEVAKYLRLVDAGIANGLGEKKAVISARRIMAQQLGIGDRAMREKIKKHLKGAYVQLAIINEVRRQDRAILEKLEAK